ncbi:MAG: hypothetical protein U0572_10495 [Phycisphaerales bacterium]
MTPLPLLVACALVATSTPQSAPECDVAAAIGPSLVRVAFTLKEDRGETPGISASARAAPRGASGFASGEQLIEDERPLEMPGWLVAPDLVLAHDPEIPSRFIASITVRQGDHGTAAAPIAWATQDAGVYLKLATPIEGARPLHFADQDPNADAAKRFSARWSPGDGSWPLSVRGASTTFTVESPDRPGATRIDRESDALVADEHGVASGVWLTGRARADVARPADPRQWPQLDERAMAKLTDECRARADASVLHVSLAFRSPRKSKGSEMAMLEESEIGTELETLGVLLDGGQLLVLADLPSKATARLEHIVVHDATGGQEEATFVASLHDWGAFVAKAPPSLSGGVALATAAPASLRDQLLPLASVRVVGRSRLNDPTYVRLGTFRTGFRGIQFPTGVDNEQSAFVFLASGELLALPMDIRTQPGQERPWRSSNSVLCPAKEIASTLADLAAHGDPSNVPLSESDESRTGWLGVMLQPLDPELARANNVAELTRDGEFGGLVTFVYPDSPAASAGIQPGAILLTVRTPRRQKPIEVSVSRGDLGFHGVFPWERLDDLPEEYYDQIPSPWPPIDDTLARTLTELGIGSSYTLDFVQDGAKRVADLSVAQSPPHAENAPRFDAKDLGVTVRDLTLEVRQYLGLDAAAPGVVVAKLEPGQRASVAGLRPLEIITHVDDEPVADAAAFGKLVDGKRDLKLTVKRANKERVVRLSL